MSFGVWAVLGLAICGLLLWFLRSQAQQREAIDVAPAPSRTPDKKRPQAAPPGLRRNVLVGIDGDVRGKTYHLGLRTVTIGRASSNFIQTLDDKASRKHCQLKPVSAGIMLADMNSRNGTKVNDETVSERLVSDGDVLRVGKACFRYHRRLAIARDDIFERKNVSKDAHRSTALAMNDALGAVIEKTLQECDGDLEQVAIELDCDVDTVKELLTTRKT